MSWSAACGPDQELASHQRRALRLEIRDLVRLAVVRGHDAARDDVTAGSARQDFAAGQPPAPLMLTLMTGGIVAMVIGFLL